jgi:hypothetical protein
VPCIFVTEKFPVVITVNKKLKGSEL